MFPGFDRFGHSFPSRCDSSPRDRWSKLLTGGSEYGQPRMAPANFPDHRKHNLEVEFSRYAEFGIGDVLESPDGEQVTVEDFAFRFGAGTFVYWTTDGGAPVEEITFDDWTRIEEGEREAYVDPGFEGQSIPTPEDAEDT